MDILDRMGNQGHPEEDYLERYVMKTCSEPEVDAIESHLFDCEQCRNRLYCAEEYVALMKSAVPLGPSRRKLPKWRTALSPVLSGQFLALPRPVAVWAGCGALAALLFAAPLLMRQNAGADELVSLTATRGGGSSEEASTAVAHSRNHLILSPDTTGLVGPLEIEVVDANGASVFSHPIAAGSTRVGIEHRLKPGQYWVRINSGAADHANLREYELRVE